MKLSKTWYISAKQNEIGFLFPKSLCLNVDSICCDMHKIDGIF